MKRHPITRVLVVALSLLLICTSVLSVPSTVEAATKPSKITVSATKKTLYVGGKYTLKVKSVAPKKASKSVTFKSSNKNIATVNSKGIITAKKKGKATITVTSKSNKKATAKCKVTVKQQVTSITVKNAVDKTVVVGKNKSLKLKTSVGPSNADNKKVTYKIKNKKIATVDSKGKIKGKKSGKTDLTIKSKDGKKSLKIKVIVPKTAVKSVTLDKKEKTIKIGESFTLKATFNPKNATAKNVTWSTSNAKVATVSSKGKVKGIKAGKVNITVTTLDGRKKATCKVTVKPVLVSGITVKAVKSALNVEETTTVAAAIVPENATNQAVTWTSSNAEIATVDSKGKVKAVAPGKVTITATAKDGSNKKGSCTITVNPVKVNPVRVTSVTLNKTAAELNIGGSVTLTATVAPANAANKTVTWTSNNTTVATVANGVVTAKAAGTAVITATADGKSATCTITVKKPVVPVDPVVAVESVTVADVTMKANETGKLAATVAPANATNKTVTYTSANSAYLTVDAEGNLVPNLDNLALVTEDTVSVKVTAKAGEKSATATVTIVLRKDAATEEPGYIAYEIDKNAKSYELYKDGEYQASVTLETIAKDIETLAGYNWDESMLRNNWSDNSIKNLVGKLAFVQEVFPKGYENHVKVTVTSADTMTVVGTKDGVSKTVYVTREDNADKTCNLIFVCDGETGRIDNINAAIDADKFMYEVTATVTAKNRIEDVTVRVESKGAFVEVYHGEVTSANLIASVKNTEAGYKVMVDGQLYNELAERTDAVVVVKNCYV